MSLVREYEHPGISAPNQGSARVQPNGNVFVGWGAAPVFSEFSRGGKLLLDGRLTRGKGNYRAIRERWTGTPVTRPAIAVRKGKHGRILVYASWNGATEVARWQVVAGRPLRGVASRARDGFETEIAARTRAARVAVRALDARGRVRHVARRPRAAVTAQRGDGAPPGRRVTCAACGSSATSRSARGRAASTW